MSTSPISSNAPTAPTTTPTAAANPYNLTPQNFIQLMVTQLQNQDPTQPTSNEDLLQQMSEIGQLESTTQLQTSLTSMTLQSQIGSAGNLIGKSVKGLDDQNNNVQGTVNSVSVQNSQVYLQLDSGSSVQMGNITSIAPGPTTTGATTTPTTGA